MPCRSVELKSKLFFVVIFSGTAAPVACPEGTWSNSSGLQTQDDCRLCLGGFYCNSPGLTKPSGPCSGGYSLTCLQAERDILSSNVTNLVIAGPWSFKINTVSVLFWSSWSYYCVEGALTSTPTDGVTGGPCPEGSYCPEGAAQPVPCDPGTYVAVIRATQCEPCLAGWHCVSGSLYLCPAGMCCALKPFSKIFICMLILVKVKQLLRSRSKQRRSEKKLTPS